MEPMLEKKIFWEEDDFAPRRRHHPPEKASSPRQENPEFALRKITHKMNNLLQGVAGNAELGIMELGDINSLRKRFNNIISGIDKMMELSKEMMQVYEPQKLTPERINVAGLAENIAFRYNDVLKKMGIKLYKCYDANVNVTTIHDYLDDIIDNTLLNAIQALGDDFKDEKIIALCINKENAAVKIKIVDTGPGMSPDILEKATRKGFTTKALGNGLGLHIVEVLSQEIGAAINLESRPGRGTKVQISLPLTI